MLPFLRSGDFDGALGAALARVDAAATPEHAAGARARPPDQRRPRAWSARRSSCSGSSAGRSSTGGGSARTRSTSTTRRSRAGPAGRPDRRVRRDGHGRRHVAAGADDRHARPRQPRPDLVPGGRWRDPRHVQEGRHRRRPAAGRPGRGGPSALGTRAARSAPPRRSRSTSCAGSGTPANGHFISSEDLPKFGTSVAEFDKALERHVVARGWFDEAPSKAISRWAGRGVLAIIGGVIALIIGFNVPISGLTLIGGAAILAGVLVVIIAQAMPAVTLNGRDDPGDARGLPADAREDHGAGALDAAGRRRGRARLARDAGPGRGVGHGARPAGPDRGRPPAQPRGRQAGRGATRRPSGSRPGTSSSSGAGFASAGVAGSGGSIFSGSGIPDIGGMMGGARHDRELAVLVGQLGRWRLLGRWLRRWRGRRRRRLLGRRRQLDRGRLRPRRPRPRTGRGSRRGPRS